MEVPSWLFWTIWGALLFGLLALSSFLESKAAMRGSKREPLPTWIDKSIRAFFLIIFNWPLVGLIGFKTTLAMFVLYLPFYLDGSEKRGRKFTFLKNLFLFRWVLDYFSHSWESEDGYVLEKDKQDLLVDGGVIDAARYNARGALDEGYSVALVPGGATEALYASPGKPAVYIKKRKGFIKLAIETGADLVPVWSHGECDTHGQLSTSWPIVKRIQKKFQSVFGLSLPLCSNIWPRKVKITCVAAKPIKVAKNPDPSDAEVEAVLNEYIAALERIYMKTAPKYANHDEEKKNPKLEIH